MFQKVESVHHKAACSPTEPSRSSNVTQTYTGALRDHPITTVDLSHMKLLFGSICKEA